MKQNLILILNALLLLSITSCSVEQNKTYPTSSSASITIMATEKDKTDLENGELTDEIIECNDILSRLIIQQEALSIFADDSLLCGTLCYEIPFFVLSESAANSSKTDTNDDYYQALQNINRFFQADCKEFFNNKNADYFKEVASEYAFWCKGSGTSQVAERVNKMETNLVYCDDSVISFHQVHTWYLGGHIEYFDIGKVFSLETGEQIFISYFIDLPYETFQNIILGYLFQQMEMGDISIIPKTVDELKNVYDYSDFSDYNYYYKDGELYIILPISDVTEIQTGWSAMIIRWSIEEAEPIEMFGSTVRNAG